MAGRRPDAAIRKVAWALDELFRIPGTKIRFGLDSVLGLLPAGGDLAGGVLSGWILIAAARSGAPPSVLLRMGGNVLLDMAIGTIPVLGDVFDVGWKANRRNADLLERHVDAPGPARKSSRVVLVLVLLALIVAAAGAVYVAWRIAHWIFTKI
jgi:hypothetical protein